MSAKIFHIADTHLRDSANTSLSRGKDFTKSLLAAIQQAKDLNCDVVTCGGDFLNTNKPSSQNIQDAMRVHRLGIDLGLPILCVTGNHDMASPSWLELASETPMDLAAGIKCVDHKQFIVRLKNGEELKVFGLPFLSRPDLLAAMESMPVSDVLLWHGAVKEFTGYPVENSVELNDFDEAKASVALLGDQHIWSWKYTAKGKLVGYPGSTELCEKSEAFEKFAALIELPCGNSEVGVVTPLAVKLNTRPARAFQITNEDDLSRVILELGQDPLVQSDERPPIVFISYHPSVLNVTARIRNAVPAKSIVRYSAMGQTGLSLKDNAVALTAARQDVEMSQMVATFIPSSLPVYALAVKLLDSEVNSKDEIMSWTQHRLSKLLEPLQS